MEGWMIAGVVALVVVALYAIWTYNRLVGLSKRADGAWSDIDVQLKRRWDLVPALVETVKGYSRHETEALQKATEARSRALNAGTVSGRGEAEFGLASAVGGIFALAEAYPDLKASENYRKLHDDLVTIEDDVQHARRYYNAVVRDLNTLASSVPAALVAAPAGFGGREFFQIDSDERANPNVSLSA